MSQNSNANSEDSSTENENKQPTNNTEPPESFEGIIECRHLTQFFNRAYALVDEAKVHISDEGLEINAADPANVAMVETKVGKSQFESFTTDGGVIGIDIERAIEALGHYDKDSLVDIHYDSKTRKLSLSADGLEITIALIAPNALQDYPDVSSLDLPSVFEIDGETLDRAIQSGEMVSEHISIGTVDQAAAESNKDKCFFEAEGDTDDVTLELTEEEDNLTVQSIANDKVLSIFSLEYLSSMNKEIDNDDKVTIELGDEFPAIIQFGSEHTDTEYMIAPRIQSE